MGTHPQSRTIPIGAEIRTNYSGPCILKSMHGPCRCSRQIFTWDGIYKLSKPHYHLILRAKGSRSDSYLNGYAWHEKKQRWQSVWTKDYLIITLPEGTQLNLF